MEATNQINSQSKQVQIREIYLSDLNVCGDDIPTKLVRDYRARKAMEQVQERARNPRVLQRIATALEKYFPGLRTKGVYC